jgi:ribosomal protein S18 acetylase RimI-like enzyme
MVSNYELHQREAIMSVTVRAAIKTDIPIIVEFNRLMALETEGKTLDGDVLTKGVAAVFADPNKGQYLVAEDGSTVLGQMMVTYEWSDWRNGWWWWIQSVYIRIEARRRGVFRLLYHHVHEAARQAGNVIGLRLYVEQDNHTAQETYRRMGMDRMNFQLFHRWPL